MENAADEECYRMALEMPLYPTLPDIEVQDGNDDCYNIQGLMESWYGFGFMEYY